MQNSNNMVEVSQHQHKKRSNSEDIPGHDQKKTRNLNDGPSSPPACSSNNAFLEIIEYKNLPNQPNQSIHINLCNDRSVHIRMNSPVRVQKINVRNQEQPTTMMEHSSSLPASSWGNESNHSFTIDLCNETSKDTSTLPARSSNNLFLQRIEPNQSIHIDLSNDLHPVVIHEPKIPHVKITNAQNHMMSTTLEYSSKLPGGSSNNLLQKIEPNQTIHIDLCNDHPVHTQTPKRMLIEGAHALNKVQTMSTNSSLLLATSSDNLIKTSGNNLAKLAEQNNHLIGTQMTQPVHIQEPIPHVEAHAQIDIQPTTSKSPAPLPASSSNNLFVLVNEPNQNNPVIGTQNNQPVHIQEPNIPLVEVERAQTDMQPTTSKQPSSLGEHANDHMQPTTSSSSLVEHAHDHMQPSTSKHKVYCEEIYHKLRAMFPNLDKEYIKTFCPADWTPEMNHEMQFNSIVDTIFMNEHNWALSLNTSLHDVQNNDPQVFRNVDDAYEQLTAIFPNADPHYLRSAAENLTVESDMTRFIEEKLLSNNYPTREQYLSKMRVTEEQLRYTKNFNVEEFLTRFPDPVAHFENKARKCQYNLVAIEFLKNLFNRLRVITINKTYRLCRYNMSVTAKNLRGSIDFIGNPRRSREIPTEDIQLLQEMAFVRHHGEIIEHMQTVKKREQEEFNLLKARGGLYTCECCFDDQCMPSKCSTCENGHIFCNSCIIAGTDTKLADGETHVPCFLGCGSEFSIATLQKVLPPTKLCIFLKKRQAAEVSEAGLEGLVCCPFCDFASIPPEGDKVFKCLNPECMKESCIMCKEPNHVPYRCGDKSTENARKYIEEKMTEALLRTCYKCKKTFFKEEGCNMMTCTCGAQMCYICGKPVERAEGYNHFNGQGSNKAGRCPLWTDNAVLNSEAVRKVEEEARKEVLRQDPNMNINTNLLAPAAQPSRPGPHGGLTDARTLASTLAARVLNAGRLNLNEQNQNQQ